MARGRCCAAVFMILGVLAMLNGIASNVIAYYTCWYMSPFTVNCSPYDGYYKLCCECCGYQCGYNCLYPYTIYSVGSIIAIAFSWGACLIFFVIAHCCRRRAMRDEMGGMDMTMTGTPMVNYGYAY